MARTPRAQDLAFGFTRPRRYLFRMALFVVAVGIVIGFLIAPLLTVFLANAALNGLIVGVGILGIIYIFRQVYMIGPEVRWLEAFSEAGPDTLAVNADPPSLLAPMARMLGDRRGRLSLSAPAMRSLLDGISARLDEQRELSRYLIGLLIFLGLLGTFWGLLQTIGAVGNVVGELDVSSGDLPTVFGALKSGLEAPLSGMGTAFSSSLFGLAGSLILGFLELQASQAQNRFYTDLEDWLSSATRLGSGAIAADGMDAGPVPSAYLTALVEKTSDNLDNLRRGMAESERGRQHLLETLTGLAERVATLTDQMRTEQSLMKRLAENQHDLKPSINRLAAALEQGDLGLDEASQGHLRNLDIGISQLREDLADGRTRAVDEIRADINMLARTIASIAEEPPR